MMYKRRVLRTLHWTKTSWTQRDRRCVTASQEGLEPPDPWTGEWVGALGWGQVSEQSFSLGRWKGLEVVGMAADRTECALKWLRWLILCVFYNN